MILFFMHILPGILMVFALGYALGQRAARKDYQRLLAENDPQMQYMKSLKSVGYLQLYRGAQQSK